MESGSSLPWQEALRLSIGENRLDASAVREYFRPLEEWLRNENLRTGEFVGWVYGRLYAAAYMLRGGDPEVNLILIFSLSLFYELISDGDYCKYSIETANLQVYGGFYNDASVLSMSITLLLVACFSTIWLRNRWLRMSV